MRHGIATCSRWPKNLARFAKKKSARSRSRSRSGVSTTGSLIAARAARPAWSTRSATAAIAATPTPAISLLAALHTLTTLHPLAALLRRAGGRLAIRRRRFIRQSSGEVIDVVGLRVHRQGNRHQQIEVLIRRRLF